MVFGVPVALWLEGRRQARVSKRARVELGRLIRAALERNQELLSQLSGEYRSRGDRWVPLYPLDLSLLDATAHQKYELGLPPDACAKLERARYELRHLEDKLSMIRFAVANDRAGHTNFSLLLTKSVIDHLPTVESCLNDALSVMRGLAA